MAAVGGTPICGRAQARELLLGRPLNEVSTPGRLQGRFRTVVRKYACEMAGSSSEASVKIEKLSNDNYVTWSANVEQVLKLKNCWEAVGPPPLAVERVLDGGEELPSRSEVMALLQTVGTSEEVAAIKAAARVQLAVLDWVRKDEVARATLHLNVTEIHHATFRVCGTARGA